MTRLADIAPRLALARDQWIAEQQRRRVCQARAAARRERQEAAADGRAKCKSTGKVRYRTQQSAERRLAHLILHTARHAPCRAYPCEHCDGWHLTSKPRRSAA